MASPVVTKYGSGNIKLWVYFTPAGTGKRYRTEGRMKGNKFNTILKENLNLNLVVKLNLGRGIIYQSDNHSRHKAKAILE